MQAERVDITLGRPQMLEIAMERSWEFATSPPETVAALRVGILQPQEAAVARGRGSAISLAALLLQCGDIEGARGALDKAVPQEYWTEHMRAVSFWQAGELSIAEVSVRSNAPETAGARSPAGLDAT